jgi:hypothetical protein
MIGEKRGIGDGNLNLIHRHTPGQRDFCKSRV